MRRLEIIGIIVAALVIVGTPAAVFGYETFLRNQNPNEYTLVGTSGVWSPSTIRVKLGQKITLRLTSGDVVHGLSVPDLDIDVHEIYPGKFVQVEFVAEKAGVYPFFCTVLCNPLHGTMKGQIVVDDGSGALSAGTTAPAGASDAGKAVYMNKCAACHGARGQGGTGTGPSIVGMTSDRITTQVRTPAGRMPPFATNLLSDEELKNVIEFIISLK